MIELTLLTRSGCPLCDKMKAVVETVAQQDGGRTVALAEIDVSADPDLEKRWGNDIPVLLCGGREIARHRVSASELADAISQLS